MKRSIKKFTAFVLALAFVFQIVSFAWAGFGAAFGPIMILALTWKRANRYGAIGS